MNIYLISEDGEHCCIRAKTMFEAINICEKSYLEDRKEEEKYRYNEKAEKEYYYEEVLTSCALVAELKN